jgi:hypothetical protein
MDQLRKLLEPQNLPKPGEYFIHDGEVYWFVSDNPKEQRLRRVLYQGAQQ